MTGIAVLERLALQPLPGGRVEGLAGAEHARHRREVGAAGGVGAVLHQHAHGGGCREDGADVVLLEHAEEDVGARMVERALVGDRGRAAQQRPVDDVRVADDPADVGGRPPDVVGAEAVRPAGEGVDADHVAAVHVHRELRRRRGARGGQDEGRVGGGHALRRGVAALAAGQEVVPVQVIVGGGRRVRIAAQHDDALDGVLAGPQRLLDDRQERHRAAAAPGDVRGDDEAGAREADAVAEGARAEPREDDGVDGADARAGQHQHDRLGDGGQRQGDPVAAADAERPQPARDPLHLAQQVAVGQHLPLAALAGEDQRRVPCAAGVDPAVEAGPGEVRLPVGEPGEGRRGPLEAALGRAEPRERACLGEPERRRVLERLPLHAPQEGVHGVHGRDRTTRCRRGGGRRLAPRTGSSAARPRR